MNNPSVLAYCALVAFALFLMALGADLPFKDLLKTIDANGKDAAMLAALALVLGFLLTLFKK
ncbi:hypothetical protein [Deinococcus planocerae]|uniref:hypothetical protein n=1 Tax=Deinococcus planocerae TaxID=1737569 RepID=UPI000C7EEF16|nr:hypothetical protein [Deinococcus planocerae]